MNPHHETLLYCRLDEIHLWGQTALYWQELYLWYGVQKIAARTYRDINRRWTEYTNEHELEKTEITVISVSDVGAVFRRELYSHEKEKGRIWKLKDVA